MNIHTRSKPGLTWIIMLVACACSGRNPNSTVGTVAATDKGTIQEIRIGLRFSVKVPRGTVIGIPCR